MRDRQRDDYANDFADANPLNLSVVVTSLSGTATAAAELGWREIR